MGKTFGTCDTTEYYNCSDAPKLICNYVCLSLLIGIEAYISHLLLALGIW